MALTWTVAALSLCAATALGRPLGVDYGTSTEPNPDFFVEAELGGKTYINKVW